MWGWTRRLSSQSPCAANCRGGGGLCVDSEVTTAALLPPGRCPSQEDWPRAAPCTAVLGALRTGVGRGLEGHQGAWIAPVFQCEGHRQGRERPRWCCGALRWGRSRRRRSPGVVGLPNGMELSSGEVVLLLARELPALRSSGEG